MPSKTTTIQIRVDEELKRQATEVLGQMHMTMSQAIKMFLGQVVNHQRIGIEFRSPSKELRKRMDQVDANIDMHEISSIEAFFEELER